MAAHWLRKNVVMRAMTEFGYSSGSFSPDYGLAGPVALMLLYVVFLSLLFIIARAMRPWNKLENKLLIGVVALALIDFTVALTFGSTRRLTLY
jgi:hypothetical protein